MKKTTTKTSIIDMNWVIAQFIGETYDTVLHAEDNKQFNSQGDFKYHNDWNWLIRAVITYHDKASNTSNYTIRSQASHLVSTLCTLKRSFIHETLYNSILIYNSNFKESDLIN